MPLFTEIKACRACNSTDLPEALNLGSSFALSDFLDSLDAHTDRAPLVLVRCSACALVQLRHTVDRERLYARYWYRSSTQPAMVAALKDVYDQARCVVDVGPGDAVVDIGANDGTLLRMWPGDVERLGFEPAQNLFFEATAYPNGKPSHIFPGYWPPKADLKGSGAKIITSIACFYDSPDPSVFVEAIKRWLHPQGVWINQLAYLPATLESNNFGDICHEHLTMWTVQSFARLLERHGLTLLGYSFNDVNGGSVRFVVGHDDGKPSELPNDDVGLLALRRFAQRIRLQRTDIRDFLHHAKRDGKRVVGYGASTKGATYLQYWDVGPNLLETIADRNPEKHGKYTPTGQFVISEAQMREERPDYLLALPYHFINAFVEREAEILERGTQFVVPFPELRFVVGQTHTATVAA